MLHSRVFQEFFWRRRNFSQNSFSSSFCCHLVFSPMFACLLAVDSWRNGALVSAAYLIRTANSRYYNHLHSTWPAKNCAKRRYLSHMFGFGLEKCGLQEELLQLVKLRLNLLISLVCLSVCLSRLFAPTQQFCTHLTLNPKPWTLFSHTFWGSLSLGSWVPLTEIVCAIAADEACCHSAVCFPNFLSVSLAERRISFRVWCFGKKIWKQQP